MDESPTIAARSAEKTGLWSLPAWLNGPLRILQVALSFAMSALAVLLCMLGMTGKPIYLPLGLLFGFAMFYLAVVVHELGHLLAARRSGMTVLRMRIGRLDFRALRDGWQTTWRPKGDKRFGGYVLAFADPRGAWRRQSFRFIAGGPLANLLVAGLAALPLLWISGGVIHGIVLAFVATNALMGLANLLPVERAPLASDGLWLLRWWRGLDPSHPDLAFARVMGLGCAGVCADQLPEQELQTLSAQEQPMPLVALYIRLRALTVQGRWPEALALREPFEAQCKTLPAALRPQLFDLLKAIAVELAVGEALVTGDASALKDDLLPPRLQREQGSLWARCLALRAASRGDAPECRRQLELAVAHARQSPDRSQEQEEMRLRERMLAALPDVAVTSS